MFSIVFLLYHAPHDTIIESGVLLDTIVYFTRLRYSLLHFVFARKPLLDLTVTLYNLSCVHWSHCKTLKIY